MEYRVPAIRSPLRESQELSQVVEAAPGVHRGPPARPHVRAQRAQPSVQGAPAVSLEREYAPSAMSWVSDQVEAYERSGGKEANTLLDTGLPVVIVSMIGNKSGKVRKIA